MDDLKTLPPLLLRFSSEERLHDLKAGNITFTPVSKYRDDFYTHYGDKNEGGIPININMPISYGGVVLPKPVSGMQFAQNDNVFAFCASCITEEVVEGNSINGYSLTNAFINKMKEFGTHCLLFDSTELINKLRILQSAYIPKFGLVSGKIIYRDLNDFNVDNLKAAYQYTGNNSDRYFVKSNDYIQENEWRLIIGGSEEPLVSNNCWGGYSLSIGKLDYAFVLESSKLNTFKMKPPSV